MLDILMVAEKPSIAETLAKALSHGQSTSYKGVSPNCAVHEYQGDFYGSKAKFKVTSTCGHLYSIDFESKYNNWDACTPQDLYTAPVVKQEASPKFRLVAHLKKEAKNVDVLVLWLDCDREGENICFEVMSVVCPQMRGRQVWRAKFSSLTPKDLKVSMKTLVEPDKALSDAVDARQEMDLRIGCSFTRFQTRYFQGRYGDLDSSCVSYGPCQTPTLYFCVERHDAVKAFQPETYHTLEASFKYRNQEYWVQWSRGQFFDMAGCRVFFEICQGSSTLNLVKIDQREDRQVRPQALNTVALLKHASQKLHISPQSAMHLAEGLYLKGIITYPRTETTEYASSFNLRGIVEEFTKHPGFSSMAQDLLKGPLKARSGHDVGDHPPITPCRVVSASELDPQAWRVYELVVQNFLASVSKDCTFLRTKLKFRCASEGFELTGRQVIDPGYTRIWGSDMQDILIPPLEVGDSFPIHVLNMSQGKTKPPPFLSESDLLGAMEKHGIGTDASMAQHIENIVCRNFVSLTEGRRLVPTKLGLSLIHGLQLVDPELVEPSVRAAMEKECNVIALGQAEKQPVVNHCLALFLKKFEFLIKHMIRIDGLFDATFQSLQESGKPLSLCGQCNKYLKLVDKKPRRLYCQTCEQSFKLPQDKDVSIKKLMGKKCPLDHFELLMVVQGARSYILCPLCYNEQPFPSEDIEEGALNLSTKQVKQGYACADCAHPTCEFGVNANGVGRCPQCQSGILVLNLLKPPKYTLDCNYCNLQIQLEKLKIHKVGRTARKCETCKANLLKLNFHKDAGAEDRTACVFCDPLLKSEMKALLVRVAYSRRG